MISMSTFSFLLRLSALKFELKDAGIGGSKTVLKWKKHEGKSQCGFIG